MPEELANIETKHSDVYEKRHQSIEERKALLAKDTEPEATEPEAEGAPQEETVPEAELTTEEATPDTTEVETEAIQYEPTEEEAEAILTEEERYCEEAVA